MDLETDLWIIDGYVATVMDYDTIGNNRDAAYLRTENFQLTSGDDFVILYGVNHEQTGKAIINNASLYGVELFNGVAVAQISAEFEIPLQDIFRKGMTTVNSIMYLRFQGKKMEKASQFHTVQEIGESIPVPYSSGNPDGKAYGVDNNKNAFIGYRIYVDKEALLAQPIGMSFGTGRVCLLRKKVLTS